MAATFLFSDIEGSTRLWEEVPEAMAIALERHRSIVDAAVHGHDGRIVKDTGDGVFAVFAESVAAARAAIEVQRALSDVSWDLPRPLRARIGIHAGDAVETEDDFFGPPVNRAARVMAAGHGGQILVTDPVATALAAAGVEVRSLGLHRLKDLDGRVGLHQIVDPALERDFPALRTLDVTPNNLPLTVSNLLGRDDELAVLAARVTDERVVTVVGAGGCGKTRLALQVAADATTSFEDGAWFVDLAPVQTDELVPDAAAVALGVLARPGVGRLEALVDHIADRRLLLVLDNCEHVLDGAASVIDALARHCPGAHVLATSREPVAVPGEVVVPLAPLRLPDGDDPMSSAAVQLFVERASASGSVALDLDAVVDVCRRLDGIPLAIELAAARVRTMSVGELATRLDDRFRLLTGGARTAMSRQRTLEAAVDWSHALLSDDERTVFRRLAVFAGSFDLATAERVVGTGTDDGIDVVGAVLALVDKSMVVADGDRYRLLETMRAFGRARLVDDVELDHVRDAHLRWVENLAVRAFFELDRTADHHSLMREIELAMDDIRAALDWAAESGRLERALLATAMLHRLWVDRSFLEGVDRLRTLVEAAEEAPVSPAVLQAALAAHAEMQSILGDVDQTLALIDRLESLDPTYSGFLPRWMSHYLRSRALPAIGRLEEARAGFEQLTEDAAAHDDEHGQAMGALYAAALSLYVGELDAAPPLCARALAHAERSGSVQATSHSHEVTGVHALLTGDVAAATRHLAIAVDEIAGLGHRVCLAHVLENGSVCAFRLGDAATGAAAFDAARRIRRALNVPVPWWESILQTVAEDERSHTGEPESDLDEVEAARALGECLRAHA